MNQIQSIVQWSFYFKYCFHVMFLMISEKKPPYLFKMIKPKPNENVWQGGSVNDEGFR